MSDLEHRHSTPRAGIMKVLAILAAVGGVAGVGAAVGLGLQHFYFEGQSADGKYHFSSKPEIQFQESNPDDPSGQSVMTFTKFTGVTASPEELAEGGIEQFQKDLEEIEVLRQKKERVLIRVIETELNGQFLSRICEFRYTLADGRSRDIREADPDEEKRMIPEQMKRDQEEIAALRTAGKREVADVMETDWDGGLQRTLNYRYLLSDGRDMVMGEADPDLPPPVRSLNGEQENELWQLMRLQKGESLGKIEKAVAGKVFNLEQRLYTLTGGIKVLRLEGQSRGQKTHLEREDYEQMRQLPGEVIGTYEKDVKGRPFVFQRKRFILKDGTVVFRWFGEPKEK